MAYVTNLLVRLDSFKGTESLLRRVYSGRCLLQSAIPAVPCLPAHSARVALPSNA